MRLRYLFYGIAGLFLLAGSGFGYLYFRKPDTAPPLNIRVAMRPERIARGQYVFTLADCDGCHSERDFSRFGGPVVSGGRGKGGILPIAGLPGRVVAPNITPDQETGIGSWTDGEKIRAIREGIGRDGRALFPLMPYQGFRYMSDEDVQSLVAFLNTLTPVRNAVPKTEIKFPVSMFIKGVPEPAGIVAEPDRESPQVYGEYLATIGDCADCHTPQDKGKPDLAMKFAGGMRFETPAGTVVSANITPHEDTGIGKWDYARFAERFRAYRPYVETGPPQVGPERFTFMPWLNLSQLPDRDLEAIFTYLRSLPPVEHKVETHPANRT